MTSRRCFLGLFGAALATAVLDPERALWVPGARTFSIPASRVTLTAIGGLFLEVGDIVTFGDWPERYVVTAACASVAEISKARFLQERWTHSGIGLIRARRNRIGDTVFKEEHMCFVNGPSNLLSRDVMDLTPANIHIPHRWRDCVVAMGRGYMSELPSSS